MLGRQPGATLSHSGRSDRDFEISAKRLWQEQLFLTFFLHGLLRRVRVLSIQFSSLLGLFDSCDG